MHLWIHDVIYVPKNTVKKSTAKNASKAWSPRTWELGMKTGSNTHKLKRNIRNLMEESVWKTAVGYIGTIQVASSLLGLCSCGIGFSSCWKRVLPLWRKEGIIKVVMWQQITVKSLVLVIQIDVDPMGTQRGICISQLGTDRVHTGIPTLSQLRGLKEQEPRQHQGHRLPKPIVLTSFWRKRDQEYLEQGMILKHRNTEKSWSAVYC